MAILRRIPIFYLILLAVLAGTFQNCTKVGPHQGGVGGVDGIIYRNYGLCMNSVGVQNSIFVSANFQEAVWIRQNCVDLSSPKAIPVADLQFAKDNTSVLQYYGQVFDKQMPQPESQRVTLEFCQGSNVQNLVWSEAGVTGLLFGSVMQADGSTTGSLAVQAVGATEYSTPAGQGGSFDLNLASSTGALTYSINGATQIQVSNLNCVSQSQPPAVVTSRASLAPPAGYNVNLLAFQDQFLNPILDATKWIPQLADQNGLWQQYVAAPYSSTAPGGTDAEFWDPARVFTGGGLKLIAQRDTSISGFTWRSAAVTTHGLFTFNGGYAQFRAKMPDSSSGMEASIWFLEGGGQINLQASGSLNGGPNPNFALTSNLQTSGNVATSVNSGTDLSSDYHIYGMEYRPGQSVKIYFDGTLQATYTQNVPTGAYTIVISLHVSQNSTWHTPYTSVTPSPAEFDVSDVQVYSLPP